MANDITNNPLIIDTASGSVVTSKTFVATKVRWVSKSASAGDDIDVQDGNGKSVWVSVATGANYVEETHFDPDARVIFEGLTVPTLDSGTLYIYVAYGVPIRT